MQLTRVTKENLEYFRAYLPIENVTPKQEALVFITEDGFSCAAALVSGADREAALDWIFVHPEYRRKGIGSTFLKKMENLLKEETSVFSASYPAGAEGMDDFLVQNGYLLTEGGNVYTVPLASLRKDPEAQKFKNMAGKLEVYTLASLNKEERLAVSAFLEEQFGEQAALFRYHPNLSFAAFDVMRCVNAVILIVPEQDRKSLFISALTGKGNSGTWAALGKALQNAEQEKEYEDYRIRYISTDEGIDRLSERIRNRVQDMEVSQIRYAVKIL